MNEKWVLRVPKDIRGETFIGLFKKYLNSDSYRVVKRYTGKRPKGTNQSSTREENATSTRLYIEPKEENKFFDYPKLTKPVTPMPGSLGRITFNTNKEVKQEAPSTISKTRLAEYTEVLKYRVEDLEETSNKHRKLNGSLKVEAGELFGIATTMYNILEQIDFSSTGINTCYDEVPWDKIEETLNNYRKRECLPT